MCRSCLQLVGRARPGGAAARRPPRSHRGGSRFRRPAPARARARAAPAPARRRARRLRRAPGDRQELPPGGGVRHRVRPCPGTAGTGDPGRHGQRTGRRPRLGSRRHRRHRLRRPPGQARHHLGLGRRRPAVVDGELQLFGDGGLAVQRPGHRPRRLRGDPAALRGVRRRGVGALSGGVLRGARPHPLQRAGPTAGRGGPALRRRPLLLARRARPAGGGTGEDGGVTAVHQLLPVFSVGDAIGSAVLRTETMLRRLGFESRIYAELYDERLAGVSTPAERLPDEIGENGAVLYHLSIGSAMAALFERLPAKRCVVYHNITPAAYYRGTNPRVTYWLERGRSDLARLAPVADLVIGVSAFNLEEARSYGAHRCAVVPPPADLGRLRPRPSHPADPPVILFVGRVAPNKRHDELIRVLAA